MKNTIFSLYSKQIIYILYYTIFSLLVLFFIIFFYFDDYYFLILSSILTKIEITVITTNILEYFNISLYTSLLHSLYFLLPVFCINIYFFLINGLYCYEQKFFNITINLFIVIYLSLFYINQNYLIYLTIDYFLNIQNNTAQLLLINFLKLDDFIQFTTIVYIISLIFLNIPLFVFFILIIIQKTNIVIFINRKIFFSCNVILNSII